MKRSNTQVIKPMFAPGFSQKHRTIDLFKHKKNKSSNIKTNDKLELTKKDNNKLSPPPKILEKSILQKSKMEGTVSNIGQRKEADNSGLKRSSSKMLIKLNSYKPVSYTHLTLPTKA